MKKLIALFVLLACSLSPALSQFRDPAADFTRNNPKFLSAFKSAVAKPSASTVRVLANSKDVSLGIIVGPDGWILTKADDLHGIIAIRTQAGKVYDAKVIGIHVGHDLALLKIEETGLIPVEFRESKSAEVGSWIACVGMNDQPVAVGVISVATRNIANKGPIGDLSKLPYLGVSLEPADGGGVKIQQVIPGAPAAKNGFKDNDVILQVAGEAVSDPDNFMATLRKHKPGDSVTFKIRRGSETLDKTATLERRPPNGSARGDMQNRMGSELSNRRSGYGTILQHDSVVRPTDCGGPIVDLEGRVVGINICRAGRVESWALPSELIQPILLELMSGKLAPKAGDFLAPKLSPDERLAQAKAAVERAERDKNRFEKEIEEARNALKAAEADVKAFRQKDSTDSADRLLNLMQTRLMIMNDVAGWKWNHRQEILDAVREKETLLKLLARAKQLGIEPDVAERFFKAQFEAARLLQQERIAGWQKDNVMASVVGDLTKDFRPRIDQINDEMLDTLVKVQRYMKDGELAVPQRLRDRSSQVVVGQGINDSIRTRSLQGLFAKQ